MHFHIYFRTVSTIQFLEAIVWYMHKHDSDKSEITKLVIALLIPLVLALEPVSSLYGASYVGKNVTNYDKILYLIAFVIIFVMLMKKNSFPDIFIGNSIQYQKNGSNNTIYYWIFYFLLIYPFIKYNKIDVFYLFIGGIVAFALWYALSKKSPGSYWCLYGNCIAIIFLFYPYIISI